VFAMRAKTYTRTMYGLWSVDGEGISLSHSRRSFPHCVHPSVLIDCDAGNNEWFRNRARRQVPVWPDMRHRKRGAPRNPPSPKSGVFPYDGRFASSYGMNRRRTTHRKTTRTIRPHMSLGHECRASVMRIPKPDASGNDSLEA
jgi:hypothetical protein